MKRNRINRNMLVSTLAVISLLLVTGYTMVVAQAEGETEESPLFGVRSDSALGISGEISVSYPNQMDEDQGGSSEHAIFGGVYTDMSWGTCQPGCVGPPCPQTYDYGNCPEPIKPCSTYLPCPIDCIGAWAPPDPLTPQPPEPPACVPFEASGKCTQWAGGG